MENEFALNYKIFYQNTLSMHQKLNNKIYYKYLYKVKKKKKMINIKGLRHNVLD